MTQRTVETFMIFLSDRPGALVYALEAFSLVNVDVVSVCSHPIHGCRFAQKFLVQALCESESVVAAIGVQLAERGIRFEIAGAGGVGKGGAE